jgi:hypothetical protein
MDELTNLDRLSGAGIQLAFHEGLILNDELKYSKKILFQATEDLVIRIVKDYYSYGIVNPDSTRIPKELLRGFTFCFDKGVEMAYFLDLDDDYDVLSDYEFENWYNGFSGDTVSESIQVEVNQRIQSIANLFNMMVEFHETLAKVNPDTIGLHEVMYIFLANSVMVGFEFCNELLSGDRN